MNSNISHKTNLSYLVIVIAYSYFFKIFSFLNIGVILLSFQSYSNVWFSMSIQRLILMAKQFHFVVLLKFLGVAYQAHKNYTR